MAKCRVFFFLLLLLIVNKGEARAGGGGLMLVPSTTAATCGNANGSVSVAVTGGTPPYQYSINGVTFQPSNLFPNLLGGVYTITVEDFVGNVMTVGVAIGDIQGPELVLDVFDATCLNNDGEIAVTTINGTSPFLYAVDGGPFGTANLIGGLASGMHTVTVKDNNGCIATAQQDVPMDNNLSLVVGPGVTICQGGSTTLNTTSNGNSFVWSPPVDLSNVGIPNPVAAPAATTTYSVTAMLGMCSLTRSIIVTVLPAPMPDAGVTDSTCYGKSVQLQGSGGVQYSWSPTQGLSNPAIADPVVEQPKASTEYSLTVIGADGCTSINPARVEVVVTPPPVVFAGDDTAVLIGQPLPLQAIDVNNNGFTSYTWSPSQGLNDPSIADPIAQITGDISYTVTAVAPDGCMGTGTIVIDAVGNSAIVVPNAFTPNGDGHNDVLRVDLIGIKVFQYFRVFNRWGQEVFFTANSGVGWDGTVGGTLQGMGTYVWMAAGVDTQGKVVQRRGTVILVR